MLYFQHPWCDINCNYYSNKYFLTNIIIFILGCGVFAVGGFVNSCLGGVFLPMIYIVVYNADDTIILPLERNVERINIPSGKIGNRLVLVTCVV